MGTNDKGYKRSWKNLLINKRYQLRFTLFMVGLSALLMVGLGFWVLSEAQNATEVDEIATGTLDCDKVAEEADTGSPTPGSAPGADDQAVPPTGNDGPGAGTAPGKAPAPGTDEPTKVPDPAEGADKPAEGADKPAEGADKPAEGADTPAAGADTPAAGADTPAEGADKPVAGADKPAAGADTPAAGANTPAAGADGAGAPTPETEPERPRRRPIKVEIGDLQLTPEARAEEQRARAQRVEKCKSQKAKLASIKDGYQRIKLVLIAFGLLLVIGLTVFGLKMTHRVAGPLYKVTLYFDKLRQDKYDQVYNLRKGDQLMEFYEHFKAAHQGLRTMQEKDVEVLRDVLEAAEKADLGARSPELAKLLDEVRATLERKESSLQ